MKKKKTVRKNSSVSIFRPIPDDVASNIWSLIGNYDQQNWEVPKDRQLLASIAGDAVTNTFYDITNSKVQNIALRNLLRDPLHSADTKKRNAAIRWIVYDWGNIPPQAEGEEDRLYAMCSEFTDYADEEVNDFAKKYKGDRIASWSKVLAFAESERYAIFDARVAMSLNYILDEIDFPRKFIMPSAISDPLNDIFSTIREKVNLHYQRKKLSYMGYMEYTQLLRNFVAMGLAQNVLEAEMRLFANGEINANKYAAKHGLKQPYLKANQLKLDLAS